MTPFYKKLFKALYAHGYAYQSLVMDIEIQERVEADMQRGSSKKVSVISAAAYFNCSERTVYRGVSKINKLNKILL